MGVYTKPVIMTPAGTNVEAYPRAFHAMGRFLGACTTSKASGISAAEGHAELIESTPHSCSEVATRHALWQPSVPPAPAVLSELEDGPYFVIASFLDSTSLVAADAACRLLRELNQAHTGPWHALGTQTFQGLELENEGVFERGCRGDDEDDVVVEPRRLLAHTDWRGRFAQFRAELPTFRSPFAGPEILLVEQADEIAYCRCRLGADHWGSSSSKAGVSAYLEVEVLKNPDNVSLAVVDFEAGGCSSVTFSPDTGAVIRERKVQEAPRKVEGAYIQPLTTITDGQGFEGSMGLYLQDGHLAFFRRHYKTTEGSEAPELGAWETTGFVTDLSWCEGRRLTPCLAFRNEGSYQVRMVCVSSTPPLVPERTTAAYQDGNWSSLDWDATEQDPPEM